jgi:hypothetical protein
MTLSEYKRQNPTRLTKESLEELVSYYQNSKVSDDTTFQNLQLEATLVGGKKYADELLNDNKKENMKQNVQALASDKNNNTELFEQLLKGLGFDSLYLKSASVVVETVNGSSYTITLADVSRTVTD